MAGEPKFQSLDCKSITDERFAEERGEVEVNKERFAFQQWLRCGGAWNVSLELSQGELKVERIELGRTNGKLQAGCLVHILGKIFFNQQWGEIKSCQEIGTNKKDSEKQEER